MTVAVAFVNLVLGTAYLLVGVLTAVEMKRDWRVLGFSHFGLAFLLMAITCGPHHLAHGVHTMTAVEHEAGALDVATAVVGLPAGVLWLALRLEAFRGGQGDRFLASTPAWLRRASTFGLAWVFGVLVVTAVIATGGSGPSHTHGDGVPWLVLANVALVLVYLSIGWVIVQTQLANRPSLGGWSVSGLCLAFVFPSCAVMHATLAAYGVAGRYAHDGPGMVIDLLSIPAALYFLAVVVMLHRTAVHAWNEGSPSAVAGVIAGS